MDDEEAELRNPFPSPPSHYTNYSSRNLRLLALLRERAPNQSDVNQYEQHGILSDQTDVPDWPLTQLEKPRVDWILEEPDAYYDVFGDRWFVKEKIPSLAELGGNQLYPADPSTDRRPALLNILRSLLVTFSSLTLSLLAPPPSASLTDPPEWHSQVEWITALSQNIMAAANDLRPVQARENLELMMRRQLELRKSETEALHSKCDTLEAKLANLRQSIDSLSTLPTTRNPNTIKDESRGLSENTKQNEPLRDSDLPTQVDVLRWAEEVG
ncbi:Mediator of RNA polymerase II transcription subunit 7 [Termitomyces sp. T112]|nr:Mediator of RNA polymerase II transcription subunit 7 [Termitomyces sp. T112]